MDGEVEKGKEVREREGGESDKGKWNSSSSSSTGVLLEGYRSGDEP